MYELFALKNAVDRSYVGEMYRSPVREEATFTQRAVPLEAPHSAEKAARFFYVKEIQGTRS
jgi:hypothetical protein